MKCKDCKGKGWTWVQLGEDDVDRDYCDKCNGTGEVFATEWDKDRQNGRL